MAKKIVDLCLDFEVDCIGILPLNKVYIGVLRVIWAKYQYNQLQSPDINQQFFWPIMTLIICVKTYKKFGLVAKIGVGTFVCLIYIQNVKAFYSCLEFLE